MTLFDRINAVLRSRMLNESPVHNVLDDQIVTENVQPMSQEEEMQARYGVPEEFIDQATLLKRRYLQKLLSEPDGAEEPLPQDIKAF